MIDLHLHSTKSDGSETPEELVVRGKRLGLMALALTDHDNMGGAEEFLAACRTHGMTGIAGVEISVDIEDQRGTLHVLGYGVNPHHPVLRERLDRVLAGRAVRNEGVLRALNELGLTVTWDEVASHAGGNLVGRVHIAQALLHKGYVANVAEAFDLYLAEGRPAYVSRNRLALTAEEGVRAIREAGGVAVVAHPFTWATDERELEIGLRSLKEMGLGGVEAIYSEYGPEKTVALLRLAKKIGLLPTGGTDYHGLAKPDLEMGKGFGSLCVPDDYLEPLMKAMGEGNLWVYRRP